MDSIIGNDSVRGDVGTSKKIRYSFAFVRARWKQMTMYILRIDDESVFAREQFVSRRYLSNISTCKCSQIFACICERIFHINFLFVRNTTRIIDVPSIHVSILYRYLETNFHHIIYPIIFYFYLHQI